MSGLEVIALVAVVIVLVIMVIVTRNAAAARKGDSVDAGSSWDDAGGGD